tara:strand:+ start:413 stop:760 length:348 start_codon:yes stop_codon:yes gene_type:complete
MTVEVEKQKKKSAQLRSGLVLPIARINRSLKAGDTKRVSASAAVYLTAALEAVLKDVLQGSGDAATHAKKKRIDHASFSIGLRGDPVSALLASRDSFFYSDKLAITPSALKPPSA